MPALALLLLALLALGGGCACRVHAPPAPTPAPERLRVGTSGDYPPFSVRAADGTLDGLDVAVARAYAQDSGRALELVPFAWPDLERRFRAGDFDVVMSGVTVRGDRLALGTMTAAVARASAVLVVPASRRERTPRDGAGLVVAVNRGGHLERVARQRLPRARIVTVDDNRSLPAVLAAGDADGVVTDSLEVASFTGAGGTPPRVALVLSEDRKAYWTRADDAPLATSLDAWLAAREADGTLARLRASYLGGAGAPAGDDALDRGARRVADLAARRLLLMPEVAAAKRVAGLPVEVPGREGEIEARARTAAERAGLAVEPYVALVRVQIEAAKAVQRAVLAQPVRDAETGPDAAARAKARLETELRPAIDRIDAALREALVAAAPLQVPVAPLAAALRADAPVPGFDAGQAEELATALRRIAEARSEKSA